MDFKNELIEYQIKLYSYTEQQGELEVFEKIDESIDGGLKIKEEIVYEDAKSESVVSTTKYCEFCCKTISINGFYHHMKRKHENNNYVVCDFDGKKFKFKQDLRAHMKTHFSIELRKKYTCKSCDSQFLSMSSLKHHENFFHSEYTEIHPCHSCEKSFSSRMKYLQHNWKVHNNSTFTCDKCNKNYASKSSLDAHINQSHFTDKEPCIICGKFFRPGPLMKSHLLTHDAPQYKCSECGKEFFQMKTLNAHLLKHFPENHKTCSDCGLTFQNEQYLKRHKVLHSNVKVQCEVANCYSTFSRRDNMIRHYQKKHKNIDAKIRNKFINNAKENNDVPW